MNENLFIDYIFMNMYPLFMVQHMLSLTFPRIG